MKIAQVVAAGEGIEPRARDVDRLVGYLTAQLAAAGHETTLIACGSASNAPSVGAARRQSALHPIPLALDALIATASRFDIIHLHGDLQRLTVLSSLSTPVVATLHSYPGPRTLVARTQLPDIALVAVSTRQRDLFPQMGWRVIVPHGLPERLHPFSIDARNYLAYVGSVKSITSVRRAVETAMRSRLPLKIADRIVGRELRQMEQQLAPLIKLGASVEFVGERDAAGLSELLGHARALLFMNEWAEPCPLAVLDALACGTPVIAWRSVAMDALLDPERSGFIVASVDEAVRAVACLEQINRLDCRRAFDERFRAQRMARDYVTLYAEILGRSEHSEVSRYKALGGRTWLSQDGAL